jgi:hypothetical protein
MAKKDPKERFFDMGVRGKFGKPWEYGQKIYGYGFYGEEEIFWGYNEYGFATYGKTQFGSDDIRWGVYQRRKELDKIYYIREEFMNPVNPQTEKQQSWRQVFIDGMEEWGNLTDTAKKSYHIRASKLGLHGVNLFMKEYLNSSK